MKNLLMVMSLLVSILFLLIFIFLNNQIKNLNLYDEKSPFECGFVSNTGKMSTFSTNYFFITIIFLMFDLEIVFISPIVVFCSSLTNAIMLTILASFFILMLCMEWMNSMIEWET